MSNDSVTVTSSQSWFSRIGSAFAGVIIGLLLFLLAFPMLAWNEGRAIKREKTLQQGEKNVISVAAAPLEPANAGKLIHVTGTTTTDGPVSDSDFGISANAIKLRRNVEMYQWSEEQKSETKKKLGGSEETVTTYTYDKKWSASLVDSSKFQQPSGHANPDEMPVSSETFVARDVKVGDFTLTDSLLEKINNFQPLPVNSDAAKDFSAKSHVQVAGGKFYVGIDPKQPAVGDLRVEFEKADPGPVSIIAAQVQNTFEPYEVKNLGSIELLQTGIFSAHAMFASEAQGNAILTWILRLAGFLMMLFGLLLIVKPLSVLADVLPFLGGIVGAGTGMLAFAVALPLTLITIALAWLAYRPLIGLPLLVLAVGSIVFAAMKLRRRKVAP